METDESTLQGSCTSLSVGTFEVCKMHSKMVILPTISSGKNKDRTKRRGGGGGDEEKEGKDDEEEEGGPRSLRWPSGRHAWIHLAASSRSLSQLDLQDAQVCRTAHPRVGCKSK